MQFEVIKPELFIKDTKLLNKYDLWENKAMNPTHICHIKSFGTKEDKEFGTENTFWFGFNTKTNMLTIKCDSYGGMCNFNFTRNDLKRNDLPKIDRDCIKYTYDLIDDLTRNSVITPVKRKKGKKWLKIFMLKK